MLPWQLHVHVGPIRLPFFLPHIHPSLPLSLPFSTFFVFLSVSSHPAAKHVSESAILRESVDLGDFLMETVGSEENRGMKLVT